MNELLNLTFTMSSMTGGRREDGTLAPPLPAARCEVAVRAATRDDLAFIDQLQKMHSHMVGFAPRQQLEGNIEHGQVLVAEGSAAVSAANAGSCGPSSCGRDARTPQPLGYIIFKDQYMGRDDVGIVYQLNVLPLKQRSLIGATLVKAAFERAAYGCRLYCCWCAQDIQANWFWESIGFVPLAFRTGSRAKQRIHIFWQRRVRADDDVTPYWFPSQTQNGAVSEDRLVLPIPPGTHWRDAKPVLLPGLPALPDQRSEQPKQLPGTLPGGAPLSARPDAGVPKLSAAEKAAILRSNARQLGGVPLGKKAVIRNGSIRYVDRTDYVAELDMPEELKPVAKPKRPKKPRHKNDPKYVAAARELRDRFLEQANAPGSDWLLPPGAYGKYDVSRQLPGMVADGLRLQHSSVERSRLLDAA